MSEEMAKQAVKVLTDNLKGTFPPKGMRDIWRELCQQPDQAISSAVDHLCLNSNGFLPSPQKLIDRVRLEAKLLAAKETKEREDEWNKQKGGSTRKELEKQETIFSREQSTAHGRHAVELFKLAINPAVSMSVIFDGFRAMEASYPGAGWAKEGASLQKWRDKRCKSCRVGIEPQAHKWYGCYGTKDCRMVTGQGEEAA